MMNTDAHHIPVDVQIFRNRRLICSCKARYLGLLGMVLDADAVGLPVGMEPEVELRLAGPGLLPSCRLRAVVSQHSRLGVCLVFQDPGAPGCEALREMIYQSWQTAAEPRRDGSRRRPTALAWNTGHDLPEPA